MTPLLLPLQQAAHAAPASGYFAELLRVVLVLLLVSAGAFFALRWLARRGALGAAVPGLDPSLQLRVLARVPLEPRKALYLVQVGERTLLLGTGEGGPPSLLLELAGRPAAAAALRDSERSEPQVAHAAGASQPEPAEPADG